MIDDSSLFHAGTYNATKAREYYLRTRELKGRKPPTATATNPGRGGRRQSAAQVGSMGKPNRSDTKSRRAELVAQKKMLEGRLDHLRDVLERLVAEAKGRSGVKKPKKDEKNTAPETKIDKADRNKAEKDAKPLTSKQKSDKAKQAKDAYEKEHPNTLSSDVDILHEQVKSIQREIVKAVEDARAQKNKAGIPQAALVRPQAKPNDGPQGR